MTGFPCVISKYTAAMVQVSLSRKSAHAPSEVSRQPSKPSLSTSQSTARSASSSNSFLEPIVSSSAILSRNMSSIGQRIVSSSRHLISSITGLVFGAPSTRSKYVPIKRAIQSIAIISSWSRRGVMTGAGERANALRLRNLSRNSLDVTRSRPSRTRALRARLSSSQAAGAHPSPTPFERRPGLASGARALQVRPMPPAEADLQMSIPGEVL